MHVSLGQPDFSAFFAQKRFASVIFYLKRNCLKLFEQVYRQ